MDLVNDRTHRVLLYVDALNRHGVHPRQRDVDAFGSDPDPVVVTTPGFGAVEFRIPVWMQESVTTEDYSDHLRRLGWAVVQDGGLVLTKTGRAMVRALLTPDFEVNADAEIILSPDDPFAYARTIHRMAQVPQALLIDPYLRFDQFMTLSELDNVKRFLISTKLTKSDRTVLSQALGVIPLDQRPEFRVAEELHDRYLLPAVVTARGLQLGVSMNGIGRSVSTLSTLSVVATVALREAYERIWDAAETLKPYSQEAGTLSPVEGSSTPEVDAT